MDTIGAYGRRLQTYKLEKYHFYIHSDGESGLDSGEMSRPFWLRSRCVYMKGTHSMRAVDQNIAACSRSKGITSAKPEISIVFRGVR